MSPRWGSSRAAIEAPRFDPAWNELEGIDDLPGNLSTEIEHFFDAMRDLESKEARLDGWGDREEALELIEKSRERYRDSD